MTFAQKQKRKRNGSNMAVSSTMALTKLNRSAKMPHQSNKTGYEPQHVQKESFWNVHQKFRLRSRLVARFKNPHGTFWKLYERENVQERMQPLKSV